jgi:protein-disulfide isomerase
MQNSTKSILSRALSFLLVSSFAVALAACGEKEEAKAPEAAKTETAAPATTPAAAPEAKKAELPKELGTVDMAKVLEPGPLPEMAIGDAKAPVTIVEYMSMTCPHCARFHDDTFEAMKEKYIDSGKVRFVLREFPLDPAAAAAIMLARCAPEGQYFPMVSVLFKQQMVWAAGNDVRGSLLQISKLAGFTQETFESCLTNQKLLDDVNAVKEKAAKDFGVSSTPTFIVNGSRYSGEMSFDIMSAIIDSKL